MQQIGAEFATTRNPRGFNHPAAATRCGGAMLRPLERAGLVKQDGSRFAYRRRFTITAAGRAAIRGEAQA
jgi:hypothetical protein